MTDALSIAKAGKAVFPCGSDKAPLVRWKDAATSDLNQIAKWGQLWPQSMIGLPCGAGNDLTVIDLDTDKETGEALGEASMNQLGLGHLLTGPSVRTPSGGMHLYFRHWDGARNSAGKLGHGIDVRAEGGYVIAPGSQSATGRYVGRIDWISLPKLPLSVKALLKAPQPARQRVFDGHQSTSSPEVAELLTYISPDVPYGDWVTVLMALHDRFKASDEGLQIALDWSARGAKFKPGEIEAKWCGFRGDGITFASIPALAREYGADLSAISRKHREVAA